MSDSIIWRDIEAFAVFCVCVANKPGRRTQRLVEDLFAGCEDGESPFQYLEGLLANDELEERLRQLRFGQYTRITRALTELTAAVRDGHLDLRSCGTEELEAIHGIGPKTSRYFLLRTLENARVAALDRHILRWLRSLGHDVPTHTPQSATRYREIEKVFLAEADTRGLQPGDLDAKVWSMYAEGGERVP